jgi:galactonate dehydratase
MELKDLEIFAVAPPPPGWGGRYWILVRVTTACGISGLGEVYASAVGPTAMRGVIEDVFARHMAGHSPEDIELMSRRVWSSGFTARPDPTVFGAFAGLEMACWDILGKARERPVWALLGGKTNDRVRAYTYLYPAPHHDDGFWIDADQAADAAALAVADGWTAVKFDPAGPYTIRGGHAPARSDVGLSARFCAAIRAAVGDQGRSALRHPWPVHPRPRDQARPGHRAQRSPVVRRADPAR